jgi:phage-related protein (TIGR01555 family)
MGTAYSSTAHTLPGGVVALTRDMVANLYLIDWASKKVVNAHPKEAFRKGFSITYKGDSDKDKNLVPKVKSDAAAIKLSSKSKEAAIWGRLFGGSGILINTDDDYIERPLIEENVGKVYSLTVLDARRLIPHKGEIDPYSDSANERFPDHEYYTRADENYTSEIDPSRLSMFGGTLTSREDRWKYFSGYDASVLQPVFDVLREFGQDRQSKSAMMKDASQGVFYMHQLWQKLAQKQKESINDRLQMLNLQKWSGRLLAIDKEREDFKFVERTFTGIKDLMEDGRVLVAAAAEMPVVIFFGISPAGMDATGESDLFNWHAIIESEQANEYQEPIVRIVRLIASSNGATDLDNWGISWANLEHLTLKEHAELEEKHANTDLVRVSLNMDPLELVKWRYGQGEYMHDPPILNEDQIADLEKAIKLWNTNPTGADDV